MDVTADPVVWPISVSNSPASSSSQVASGRHMVSHNPFDPTIAPNAGSPYQARSAFWTLSNDLQKKQEEARSFHTVWKVCARAIPIHLHDHVLVARSIDMEISR